MKALGEPVPLSTGRWDLDSVVAELVAVAVALPFSVEEQDSGSRGAEEREDSRRDRPRMDPSSS